MLEAFVTLVATDPYAAGALVLNHQLRKLGSVTNNREFVCLVTPNISDHVLDLLSKHHIHTIQVDTLCSNNHDNLQLLGRPELDITFTKIHLWKLTQYSKVVFLDADTFPVKDIGELFNIQVPFAAASDAGWPDCFNSGVFVTEPSETTYNELLSLASTEGSFDGGDQGLLNSYFDSWSKSPEQRLPFTFNTTPTAQYGYLPAFQNYRQDVSIVHFIGVKKPWRYQRFADGHVLPIGDSWDGVKDMIEAWWSTWDEQFGKTSPYQLLLSHDTFSIDQISFDTGFQTRPIETFSKQIENAWDNKEFHLNNYHKHVETMPPVATITTSEPEWYAEEVRRQQQIQREEDERRRQEEEQRNKQREEERQNRLKEQEYHRRLKEEEHRNRQREEEHQNQMRVQAYQNRISGEKREYEESEQRHMTKTEPQYHHIEAEERCEQPNISSEEHHWNAEQHQQQSDHVEKANGEPTNQQDCSAENTSKEIEDKQHHIQSQSIEEPKTYSMIDWDPAREAPPNSGTVTANIPDLSSYKNAWDQPEQTREQSRWETSVLQPNADVLASIPEYAEYRLEEYKGDAYQSLVSEPSPPTPSLCLTQTAEPEKEPVEEPVERPLASTYHDETDLGLEELQDEGEDQTQPEEIQYPPAFPWEAKEGHFPPPSRIWLDELPHSERQRYESRIQHCNMNKYPNLLIPQTSNKQQGAIEQASSLDHEMADKKQTPKAIPENSTDGSLQTSSAEELRYRELDTHPFHIPHPNDSIESSHTALSEKESIPALTNENNNVLTSSSLKTACVSDDNEMFALNSLIMCSKSQHKLDEFTASITADEDEEDISARNMIPINFKPTSRLQSGFHTPSSDAGSRSSSKSCSRRASVAVNNPRIFPPLLFRRDSIPIINMIPADDVEILRRPSVSSTIQEDAESVYPQGVPIEKDTTYSSDNDVDAVMSAPIFEDPFKQH